MSATEKTAPACAGAPASDSFQMSDDQIYPFGGTNERYGPLNGWNLLESAEDSLAEKIEDKTIAACPASLQADLLKLNQLEQINENTERIACFVVSLEEALLRELKENNALLHKIIELAKCN